MTAELAYAYGAANRLEDAERLFGEIKQLGGLDEQEHPLNCATMLGKQAEVYFRLRRFEEAESLERRALHIRERIFPADQETVLKTKSNLASTLNALGRHADAEPLCRDVLAGRQKHAAEGGVAVARIAWAQRNLATVLSLQGKLDEALPLLAEALEGSLAVGMADMATDLKTSIEKVVQELMKRRSGGETVVVVGSGAGTGDGGKHAQDDGYPGGF